MQRTYKSVLLFFGLALVLSGVAQAQQAPTDAKTRLMQYAANNAPFDTRVKSTAQNLFIKQIDACKTYEKSTRQLPTMYGDITFPPDPNTKFPNPIKGLWVEHIQFRGCNKIWNINMLTVAKAGAAPILLGLLPGDTLTDPATQSTAERTGAREIKKADAQTCAADAKARYTTFLGYRQANGTLSKTDARLGWFEEWTYNFCQKTIPVQMAFIPNTKGGIDVKARIVPAVAAAIPAAKPETSTAK